MKPVLVPQIISRRHAFGSLGLVALAGCGGGDSQSTTGTGTTTSTDASLSSLAVSNGSLSPTFATATITYAMAVANTVTSVTVTATANASGASVRVNGTTVASGVASAAITLATGANSLAIVVTAADGTTTRTYAVTVTRAAIAGTCVLIPQETQGPFPLLAVLSNTAMVRADVRESKTGIPLSVVLRLENLNNACAPIVGAAVYIWHCDKEGEYSGYSGQANGNHVGETFLRGIQVTDSTGTVRFTTIYPGWYAGRITHIHFQIYLNNNLAVTATATSQLGFEPAITSAVYADALYTKGQNTSVTSFAADNVFADGTTYQIAATTGSNALGYTAELGIGIAG
jgi:protocatechuate 3,4-dioxygenase beta subunit